MKETSGGILMDYKKTAYTIADIYTLPEGQRAELIDGVIYNMVPPNRIHQKISAILHHQIISYIEKNHGNCEAYAAPFAVFLNEDDKNYVEPDISVVCDKNKLTEKGCIGAPDWIIEIVSPYSQSMDYRIKLFKYRAAGVREYWIVNPRTRTVQVYDFENGTGDSQYSFDDNVSVGIYNDLCIRISDYL